MKTNHIKIQALIKQAILLCNNHFALEETASCLRRALAMVTKASDKRTKRETYAQKFLEEAKNRNKKWFDQIAENAKKSAEAQLETPKEDSQEST